MAPHVCEEWDTDVPNYRPILDERVTDLLAPIFQAGFDTVGKAGDTRKPHKFLYKGLTPPLYPHFAGNYRGAPKDCLEHRPVMVGGDPRVGSPPEAVAREMEVLRGIVVEGFRALDAGVKALDTTPPNLTRGEFLTHAIQFGCAVFQVFLRIHPFANGNGHMGRYILWITLARYGFKFYKFPVEPRTTDSAYVRSIKAHRDGKPAELEAFILDCVSPESPP